MFLLYILLLLVVIELITLIHESGHFLIAKKNGVRVAEFSIGFGGAIYQRTVGDTTYSLRWLPFGGYVSVLSKDVIREIEKIREKNDLTDVQIKLIEKKLGGIKLNEDFEKQKPIEEIKTSRKILFACAGVLFNFISIFVILFFSYAFIGKGEATDQIFIRYLESNDKISDTFFLINDMTFTVEGGEEETVSGYDDMRDLFTNPKDEKYNLEYQSFESSLNNQEIRYSVIRLNITEGNFDTGQYSSTPDDSDNPNPLDYGYFITFDGNFYTMSGEKYNEDKGMLFFPSANVYLGFNNGYGYFSEFKNVYVLSGFNLFWEAFVDTFRYFWISILLMIDFFTLGLVNFGFHPSTSFNAQAYFFQKIVFFTINLTVIFSALMIIFNMLPIPPLDGWRAVEYGYEGKKKKQISRSTTSTVTKVGWGLIALCFILGIFI